MHIYFAKCVPFQQVQSYSQNWQRYEIGDPFVWLCVCEAKGKLFITTESHSVPDGINTQAFKRRLIDTFFLLVFLSVSVSYTWSIGKWEKLYLTSNFFLKVNFNRNLHGKWKKCEEIRWNDGHFIIFMSIKPVISFTFLSKFLSFFL